MVIFRPLVGTERDGLSRNTGGGSDSEIGARIRVQLTSRFAQSNHDRSVGMPLEPQQTRPSAMAPDWPP